jgi:hypothetical protein
MLEAIYIPGHGHTVHDSSTGESLVDKNGRPIATHKAHAVELAQRRNDADEALLGTVGRAMREQGIH